MKAQPAPVVSGRYFSADFPATCFHEIPLAEGLTSSNGKVGVGRAPPRRGTNPSTALLATPRNSCRLVSGNCLSEIRDLKSRRPFRARSWKKKAFSYTINQFGLA